MSDSSTAVIIYLLTDLSWCRIINCIPKFIEPILDLIADHTGWKLTMIAGGPEPADGGRLNVIRYFCLKKSTQFLHALMHMLLSVHSGVTTGSVKMNYGRSERIAYKEQLVPSFGRFLAKCYCKSSF